MLFLGCGGLVAGCEVQACVVKLGFQVTMGVKPEGGIGYWSGGRGESAVSFVGGCGAGGYGGGEIEKGAPGGCVSPLRVWRCVNGLQVSLEVLAALFGEFGICDCLREPGF